MTTEGRRPSLRLVTNERRVPAKPRHLETLLKCVNCQRRPAAGSWDKLPICSTCGRTLRRAILRNGRVVMDKLEQLKHAEGKKASRLSDKIVKHASRLVPFEDKKLTTLIPKPSDIIHHVRRRTYEDLQVRMFLGEESDRPDDGQA